MNTDKMPNCYIRLNEFSVNKGNQPVKEHIELAVYHQNADLHKHGKCSPQRLYDSRSEVDQIDNKVSENQTI